MIETYYAGSYWLARPESAEACARRAERFFRGLRVQALRRRQPMTWDERLL